MIRGADLRTRAALRGRARRDRERLGRNAAVGGRSSLCRSSFTRLSFAQPDHGRPTSSISCPRARDRRRRAGQDAQARNLRRCPFTRRGSGSAAASRRRARTAGTTTISRSSGTRHSLRCRSATRARSRSPCVFTSATRVPRFQPGGTRVAGFGPQLVARYAELGLRRSRRRRWPFLSTSRSAVRAP